MNPRITVISEGIVLEPIPAQLVCLACQRRQVATDEELRDRFRHKRQAGPDEELPKSSRRFCPSCLRDWSPRKQKGLPGMTDVQATRQEANTVSRREPRSVSDKRKKESPKKTRAKAMARARLAEAEFPAGPLTDVMVELLTIRPPLQEKRHLINNVGKEERKPGTKKKEWYKPDTVARAIGQLLRPSGTPNGVPAIEEWRGEEYGTTVLVNDQWAATLGLWLDSPGTPSRVDEKSLRRTFGGYRWAYDLNFSRAQISDELREILGLPARPIKKSPAVVKATTPESVEQAFREADLRLAAESKSIRRGERMLMAYEDDGEPSPNDPNSWEARGIPTWCVPLGLDSTVGWSPACEPETPPPDCPVCRAARARRRLRDHEVCLGCFGRSPVDPTPVLDVDPPDHRGFFAQPALSPTSLLEVERIIRRLDEINIALSRVPGGQAGSTFLDDASIDGFLEEFTAKGGVWRIPRATHLGSRRRLSHLYRRLLTDLGHRWRRYHLHDFCGPRGSSYCTRLLYEKHSLLMRLAAIAPQEARWYPWEPPGPWEHLPYDGEDRRSQTSRKRR